MLKLQDYTPGFSDSSLTEWMLDDYHKNEDRVTANSRALSSSFDQGFTVAENATETKWFYTRKSK